MSNAEQSDKHFGDEHEPLEVAKYIRGELREFTLSSDTELLVGWSEGYLNRVESGEIKPEDGLFFAGVGLVHAKVLSGELEEAVSVDGGWYVDNKLGWDIESDARIVIPAYLKGFSEAKRLVPESIQSIVKPLYQKWIEKDFGVQYSDAALQGVLDPKPVIMPFDHFTDSRELVGGQMKYPADYDRRVFGYMKAWAYPPTMWYSEREENDFIRYAKNKAEQGGIAFEEAVSETGRHEGVHVYALDPIVGLVMKGPKHSWLTEGIAQYYGESRYVPVRLSKVNALPGIFETADTLNKPVDYSASLLLTMGLASKLGDSTKDGMDEGMTIITQRLAIREREIAEGKEVMVNSPSELLYIIDPTLRKESGQEELKKNMELILSR